MRLWIGLAATCILAVQSSTATAQSIPEPISARGTVQVAFTPWDNAEGMIVDAINRARTEVLVQAYGFTSRTIADALLTVYRRGVRVRLLADREQTFSGDNSRVPELASAGISVSLEVRYQSAHNKVIVIDPASIDGAVITGSYNWTYSAQRRNSENVVIFRRSPELVKRYTENWYRHFADALPYDSH